MGGESFWEYRQRASGCGLSWGANGETETCVMRVEWDERVVGTSRRGANGWVGFFWSCEHPGREDLYGHDSWMNHPPEGLLDPTHGADWR